MRISLVVDINLPGPDIFNCHNHIQLSSTNNLIFAFLPYSTLLPLDPSYLDHAHKESLVVQLLAKQYAMCLYEREVRPVTVLLCFPSEYYITDSKQN